MIVFIDEDEQVRVLFILNNWVIVEEGVEIAESDVSWGVVLFCEGLERLKDLRATGAEIIESVE